MYDLEGHLLEVFTVDTITELEEQLKIPRSSLNNAIAGNINHTVNRQFRQVYGGVTARPLNKIGSLLDIPKRSSNIPVHKYYKGTYICSYPSALKAAEANGLNDGNINRCCKGLRKSIGGFSWKYANDET